MTLPLGAAAHLLPAQNGTLNVVGNTVYAAVALPVSALQGFDDNGSGLLEPAELQHHEAALKTQIDRRLRLMEGDVLGSTVSVVLLYTPNDAAPAAGSSTLTALKIVRFDAPPQQLAIHTDLFGSVAAERQFTLKAMRGAESEAAVLTPAAPSYRFFASGGWVFAQYLATGIEHILLGADHLLFLLTILAAGQSWRHWVLVLTAFTAAHSLSFAAAALGGVPVAPAIVEPAIAASIVLMALHNLFGRSHATAQRAPLVFGCGLIHGLGFASSMREIGLDTAHLFASLVGFNAGIEVGQLLFVGMALALLRVAARWRCFSAESAAAWARQTPSGFAALVGTLWFVGRLTGTVH